MIGIGSHCSRKLCIIRGYASQNGGTFQKATKYLQNAVSNRFYHKTLETGPYFFPGSEISEIRHKSDKKSAWKTPILNYASQNGVLVFGLLQFYKAPHWLLWPTGSQRNYKVLIWHPSCNLKSPPLIRRYDAKVEGHASQNGGFKKQNVWIFYRWLLYSYLACYY